MTLGDFTEQAESYRRARPGYPESLVDLLVADAKIVSGDPVVDFGAGTGIFTRFLVERGFAVTAIEPNDAMRSRNDVPYARWLNATFDQSGLPDMSQHWAVAAQSFHWAHPPGSLPEIHRILQADCLLTVVWNNRANRDSEILSWTEDAIRRLVPDFDEAYRDHPWQEIVESTGHFEFVAHRMAPHVVRMSKQRYLELWKSHNRLKNAAGPMRIERLLSEITLFLEKQHVDEVDVPYRCESWSARRVR